MLVRNILATALMTVSWAGHAEETKPIPSFPEWRKWCMTGAEQREPGHIFGSSVERGAADALCSCQYRRLPRGGEMTQTEYISSAKQCLVERKANPATFTTKYLTLIKNQQ